MRYSRSPRNCKSCHDLALSLPKQSIRAGHMMQYQQLPCEKRVNAEWFEEGDSRKGR